MLVACNSSVSQDQVTASTASTVNTPPSKPAPKKVVNANEIQWMTLEEAQAANKSEPRKLIVDMYTPWCGPCKMMDRGTFRDPEVVKFVNANYYAVKFNAESGDPVTWDGKQYANPNHRADLPPTRRNYPHQFTQAMGIRGYPTLLIFDNNLRMLEQAVGYKRPADLMQTLKKIEGKS